MLSLSAEASQTDVSLELVNGAEGAGGDVAFATQLMKFAEALAQRDEEQLVLAREALRQSAGDDCVVDAAGVAGNFQRMVRIADATGIPIDDHMSALGGSIIDKLELRRFASAQNTPAISALKKALNVPKGFLMRKLLGLMGSR